MRLKKQIIFIFLIFTLILSSCLYETQVSKTTVKNNEPNEPNVTKNEIAYELQTSTKHSDKISSVSLSFDEKYLASASFDKIIKIWKQWEGGLFSEIQTLNEHSDSVSTVAFSFDGKYLISGSLDKTIKVWKKFSEGSTLGNFSEIQTLIGHSKGILTVSFSLNNDFIASGGLDQIIKIWKKNPQTGLFYEFQTLKGHSNDVSCLVFGLDEKYLASGSFDKTIKFWRYSQDKQQFTLSQTLKPNLGEILSMSFSPNGQYLASSGTDKIINIFKQGQDGNFLEVQTLKNHSDEVSTLSFSPDGNFLASGSFDKTVKIWKLEDNQFKEIQTINGQFAGVSSLTFGLDGKHLVFGTLDKSIKIFKLNGVGSFSKAAKVNVDKQPPKIEIIEPEVKKDRGIFINSKNKEILVRAKISGESGIYEVTINGVEANLSSSGEFWAQVKLSLGENKIKIKAVDSQNNITEETLSVKRSSDFVQPPQVLTANLDEINTENISYHALLIASQDYQDTHINSLDFPIQDAQKVRDVLINNYSFEEQNVLFLKNPTRKDIIKTLEDSAEKLTEKDNLLIFYAGHGYWNKKSNQGFWLPSNASRSDSAEWLSNTAIRDYIDGIKTKHTLLISDACFSGGIFKTKEAFSDAPKHISEIYKLSSRKALTSGALEKVPDRSAFVEYFVKKLEENKEKYFDAQKLYMTIREPIINNSLTNQKPLYGVINQAGDEGGDFIFIKKQK